MAESRRKRIAVIGAGVAGLAAAYRLSRLAARGGVPLDLTVLEAAARAGGAIETVVRDGFVMERGPDSIVTEKPRGIELCREVGLGDRILPTNREHAGSLVFRDSRLFPVPDGLHLMAPSRLLPFLASPLLSWPGKLRVAIEPFIPRRLDLADESLADFVRRRLGNEALVRLAQPMVGGVYTADPEKLSLRATMPRFIEHERRHGSVIRGMVAARRSREVGLSDARGPRYELFVSLRGGLEDLTRRLVERLPAGVLRLGSAVERMERTPSGWSLATSDARVEADAVCIAAPAHAAARLVASFAPSLASELGAIEHASSATINLVYRGDDVGDPLEAFGFVVPAVERLPLIACTYSSRKYAARAREGTVLLRAFVGGALFPEHLAADDAALVDSAHACLARLLRIRARPLETMVSRYPHSMPQYHVGHLARVERIDAAVAGHPTLALAGNAYRGTGIPDCIASGETGAEKLFGVITAAQGTF